MLYPCHSMSLRVDKNTLKIKMIHREDKQISGGSFCVKRLDLTCIFVLGLLQDTRLNSLWLIWSDLDKSLTRCSLNSIINDYGKDTDTVYVYNAHNIDFLCDFVCGKVGTHFLFPPHHAGQNREYSIFCGINENDHSLLICLNSLLRLFSLLCLP